MHDIVTISETISVYKYHVNIGYDIVHDIVILVRITCLNRLVNRNAWWWRSRTRTWKRVHSPRELFLGHVGIVRHALKKAGVGSKVGSRSRSNARILVHIIAQLIFVHLSIATAIAVIIVANIVLVPGRST